MKRRTFQGIIPKWLVRDDGRYTLNGKPLSEYGLFVSAAGMTVGEVQPAATYRSVPGMDGDHDVSFTNRDDSLYLPRRTVSLAIGCVGLESDFIRAQVELAALMGKIVQLRDNMQPGYWSGRLSIGEWETERNYNGCFVQASTTLSIEAQPYMLGETVSKTWSAAGSQTVNIPGNRQTWPVFTITPVSASANISLTCRDYGDSVNDRTLTLVKPFGGWGAVTITVDMEHGAVSTGSNPFYGFDMTTNFWPLSPGLQNIGLTNAKGSMEVSARWIM